MRLSDVMDEVAAVLGQFSGLAQIWAYPPSTVKPPAAIVSYPEKVDYDATYGRGIDKILGLPILILAGKPTDRTVRDKVAVWAAGGGEGSLKAAFEARTWTSCDDLTITDCSFDVVTIAGVDYLAAMFSADIIGEGA